MKIYIIPVDSKLQPDSQSFQYPSHNEDFGVEQDFLIYLLKSPELTTSDPELADWHYLPVYWTRWHINHGFAANDEGLDELEEAISKSIIDPAKTFSVTQFDGGTLLKKKKILEFTAAKTTNRGIDIPILCSEHKRPLFRVKKKYHASFNGSFDTHVIREEMREHLTRDKNILIGGNIPTRFLKRMSQGKQYNLNTLASYIALCPRGTSCNSFRFFEAMQLGVAPCLIGDQDVRPFKKFLNWDEMSYYVKDIHELKSLLSGLDKEEAIQKGKMARKRFYEDLYYQHWCKYVIKELQEFPKNDVN